MRQCYLSCLCQLLLVINTFIEFYCATSKVSIDSACTWFNQDTGALLCRVPEDTNTERIDKLLRHVAKETEAHTVTINFGTVYEDEEENNNINTSYHHCVGLCNIALQGCRWNSLPATLFRDLHDTLQNVTVHCVNNEEEDIGNFTIEPGAIAQLQGLKKLDLSGNKVAHGEYGEFCFLQQLQNLDISNNQLAGKTGQLGFGYSRDEEKGLNKSAKNCASGLQILDASNNQLESVTSCSFCGLTELTELHLYRNHIQQLEPGSFKNLKYLKLLNLASNFLTTINSSYLWTDVPSLTHLYLSDNQLNQLRSDEFHLLNQLKELHLQSNNIKSVHRYAFRDVKSLQALWLNGNKFSRILPRTFEHMTGLATLALHNNNRLESINETTLNGLDNVEFLYLSHCRISSIHPKAFSKCCRKLRHLTLHDNKLIDVPNLSRLTNISQLSLSDNFLTSLQPDTFAGLVNLKELTMAYASVGNLPSGILNNLVKLSSLSLSLNSFEVLPVDVFVNNINLEELKLDTNELKMLPNLTETSLRVLHLEYNKLQYLDTSQLPVSLKILDISNNLIESVHQSGFYRLTNLQEINLSENKLVVITGLQFPVNVSILNFSENKIETISRRDFENATSLTRVSLSNNQLRTLNATLFSNLKRTPSGEAYTLIHGVISGLTTMVLEVEENPFTCDCSMSWIKELSDASEQVQEISDTNNINNLINIRCCLNDLQQPQCPNFGQMSEWPKLIDNLEENFLCPYQMNLTVDGDVCDSESTISTDYKSSCLLTCPESCQCHYSQKRNKTSEVVTVCSWLHLPDVPEKISILTSILYLDGNNLTKLMNESFGSKNLFSVMRKVFLNNSLIEEIENSAFSSMPNLHFLHLGNNHLKTLPDGIFFGQRLGTLDLSANRLISLPDGVFINITSLSSLQLSNNSFTQLPALTLPTIREFGIEGNPFTCSCQNMDIYKSWQQSGLLLAVDSQDVLCLQTKEDEINDNNETDYEHLHINFTKITDYGIQFCLTGEDLLNIIPIIVTISLLVVVIVVALLIYVYRYEVQVLLFNHFNIRFSPEEPSDGGFDAFVAYCKEDEWFVAQELVPRLEGALVPPEIVPYSLCLHERNFAGGSIITESIREAVEHSRRTLVVMSRNFVASTWCRFEFKTAHYQMMSNSDHRIIVILLPSGASRDDFDIPDDELDSEMRLYMRTNTYLRWGDSLFWQKLYYAMPDRPPRARVVSRFSDNSLPMDTLPPQI